MSNKNENIANKAEIQVVKEKNGVAYRLNNRILDQNNPTRNIIKNIFYKYINIMPMDNETKEIITNIKEIATEELHTLLSITLNHNLKEYISQSRTSKAQIKASYNKLINIINTNYQTFKINEEEILVQKTSRIEKRLNEIEGICSGKIELLTSIRDEVKDKISNVSQKRILLAEERKKQPEPIQKFLENKQKELDQKIRSSSLIDAEIQSINDEINILVTEKKNLISDLNNSKHVTYNKIDKEFAKKEKRIAALDIEKVEVYIWIRNCLVLLNRLIRDVKIELGLRKIETSWKKILGNFDEIRDHTSKIFNDFSFFDSIANVENKINTSKKINLNKRIINTKTSEEIINE